MVGFGGAVAFRDWLRAWTERLERLDAYVRARAAAEQDTTPLGAPGPDDHRHRRK